MIHLLALRPYKKPELLARLMKGKVLRISEVPCVFIIPTITNLGGWGGGGDSGITRSVLFQLMIPLQSNLV